MYIRSTYSEKNNNGKEAERASWFPTHDVDINRAIIRYESVRSSSCAVVTYRANRELLEHFYRFSAPSPVRASQSSIPVSLRVLPSILSASVSRTCCSRRPVK